MSKKSRRAGTRGGGRRLPTDIADAAEAALDDMLSGTQAALDDEEPRTETRALSQEQIIEQRDVDDDRTGARHSKIPLPAPKTTAVHTLQAPSAIVPAPAQRQSPVPRPSPVPTPAGRPSPVPMPAGRQSPVPASAARATPVPAAVARPSPVPAPAARPSSAPRELSSPPLSLPRPSSPLPRDLVPTRESPMPRKLSQTPATNTVPARPAPTPRSLSVLDELEMQASLPRALSRGATHGETPQTRAENTTSERPPSIITADDPLQDSIPEDLPLDLESGPVATDPDELVPVRPDLASLQVVIFEESAHLTSLQSAIAASGHVVNVAASGRDGVARVVNAIRGGGIDVVLVSLPSGEPIIQAARALEEHRPIVIALLSGSALDAIGRAHAAGADLAITRPHDVDRLAPIMLAATLLHTERRVAVIARGTEQALRERLDEISDPDPRGLLPFEMFQRVLELEIKRAKRFEYPLSVALFAVEVAPPPPPAGIRGILRARAGNALINTIRDIDIATQLDHERFLVLLPYTDLKGSAHLARRVIAAVAKGDPVIAGGRSFPPRVVGAVAGGGPGQQLSFATLMKNATRALDQARRDGAELAVQP